jgi:hypothetical protein
MLEIALAWSLARLVAVAFVPAMKKFVSMTHDEKAKLAPLFIESLVRKASDCDRLKGKVNEGNKEHFKTLGRLHKYEDTVKEALALAVRGNMCIKCNSRFIGVYAEIREYKNARGDTHLAHYKYNKYMGRAKSKEDKKSYEGYFLYKDYKEQFDRYLKVVKSFETLDELFNLTGTSI